MTLAAVLEQLLVFLVREGYLAHGSRQFNHVSAYATSHPWEDWAETWAHYLHMVDTLETARSLGLALRPKVNEGDLNEVANLGREGKPRRLMDRRNLRK